MRKLLLTVCVLLTLAASACPAPEYGLLFGQSPAEFAARRAAVRTAANGAVVLLCGPGSNEDVGRVRFRTTNDVMYLTGVEAPNACLAILPPGDPSGKRDILFLPPQDPEMLVWSDPEPAPDARTQRATGIDSIQDLGSMWSALGPSLKRASVVTLLGPVGAPDSRLPEGSDVAPGARYYPNAGTEEEIKRIHPGITITGLAERLIHPLRWRKSAGELRNLRAAIAATGDAERSAARSLHEGVTELAIEGVILSAFRRGGAVREGFPCIVGSGPNSTVLHHFSSERRMHRGEVVVMDIGAEYNYYSADITRTFPVGGRFTPRQRQLYQLVLDTQTACQKYVRPGKTTLRELHRYAVQYLHRSPLRARDRSGELHTMDYFFPHGLGHWLGMDVHDVGGGSDVLEPGVVFTIEPGVYVPSEGIGFRIEDDYLVTPAGAEKLSAAIPSQIAQVEAMAKGH